MSGDDLLAGVVAAPNDDGPRLVYADWLQQQPDSVDRARGEYIALACSTQRSPARTARMQALIAEHEPAWLGAFAACTAERVWARGFVEACALQRPATAPHPAWCTLRLLDARDLIAHDAGAILALQLPALRALCVPAHFIAGLATSATAPSIGELAICEPDPARWDSHAAVSSALADGPCFARLRRLHVTARWTTGYALQLARPNLTLAVSSRPTLLGGWLALLEDDRPAFEEIRLVEDIPRLLAREGFELVLRRDGDTWSHLELRWSERDVPDRREEILSVLARLQRDRLTRVTFVGPDRAEFDVSRWRTRIRQALARQTTARIG